MELEINEKENKLKEVEKNKELLVSILKQKLETRLSKLERKNKIHMTIMNTTSKIIKDITNWSINTNNQIKEKLQKNKSNNNNNNSQKTINKNKKYEKIEVKSNNNNNTIKQSFRSKTPLRTNKTKSYISEETKALTLNRNNIYSKSNKYLNSINNTNTKTNISSTNKKKRRKTINNINEINIELKRPSILSNKSNKSNITSTSKKNKNIETPNRKKTPYKKRNIEKNNLNIKLNENKSYEINSKIIKKVKKNKEEITKMENELEKDEFINNNNDPLLIAPITDSDFKIDIRMSGSSVINFSNLNFKEKEKILNPLLKKVDENIYCKISNFLNTDDLMQFKNISKYFHKLFIQYISNYFKKDIIFFSKKLKNLNISNIPKRKTIDEFNISDKCTQAIKLLNDPQINKFFFEKSLINDNRLIIYRIYFQLIKHPNKNIIKDKKEEFWEKCIYYFSRETTNGKVGELLLKILNEKKINLEGNNLYKIYKLVYKDLDKIYPNYFSKICGPTGLFTIFIKDILDFIGISNNIDIQINAYWTYTDIIENLKNKINYLQNSKFNLNI